MPADLLKLHRQDLCRLRTVPCKFCNMPIVMADKDEHEQYCGSKTRVSIELLV